MGEIVTKPTSQLVLEAAKQLMPYGKYKGRRLIDIPEFYLIWYQRKGWPAGLLGKQLALMMEIKINGLEDMIRRII
ncbi:MAG: hypothetical protein CFE24_00095 [Flavobacterium sp. BFFFF2]|nr:MAG: hypothetical protein CFE24_00095 [Flavobacterium sp. BFFFF2]